MAGQGKPHRPSVGPLIAFQEAGRATRDALFLSHFSVTTLPRMIAIASVVALVAMQCLAKEPARQPASADEGQRRIEALAFDPMAFGTPPVYPRRRSPHQHGGIPGQARHPGRG